MEMLSDYQSLIMAMLAMGVLMLVQLLVVDVLGILSKHKPGTPVEADHDLPLFRAVRALANTNESIAIFLLFSVAGVLSQAEPGRLAGFAWTYLAGRLGHMVFYYANLQIARSAAFALSVVGLAGLCVSALLPWFS